MIEKLRIIHFKGLHPKIITSCEAPSSMISHFFGKKQLLRGTFGEIWHIKIQIYPQTSFEHKYSAFNLTIKVSAHGLVLLVQLS